MAGILEMSTATTDNSEDIEEEEEEEEYHEIDDDDNDEFSRDIEEEDSFDLNFIVNMSYETIIFDKYEHIVEKCKKRIHLPDSSSFTTWNYC